MIATAKGLFRSDFARHGVLVFAANLAINVLGYAFHFAISRKLGVEQYGVLAALNAAYMIGMLLAAIAATIVIKYAAEFRATGDRAHLAALVRFVCGYGSLATCVVIALGYVCAPLLAGYLHVTNVPAVTLCIAIVGISNTAFSARCVFSGMDDFTQYSVSAVMESTFKAVLGIGFVYAGYGVLGAFVGWTIASTISLVYTVAVLVWRFRDTPPRAFSIDPRRLAKTTAGVSAGLVLITSISYFDVIVVKHFADATTAGLYGALSLSGKILLYFVAFVPTILLPKASARALAGKSVTRVLVTALAVTCGFSIVGLAGYYAFPGLILTTLAGASFAAGSPFVFSYGIAMALLAALTTVVTFKIGIHRFDFVLPLAVCAAGELAGIALYHATLAQIIDVLIAGNALALVVSSYRITSPARPAASARPEAA